MTSSRATQSNRKSVMDLTQEPAHTSDDIDIGDIEAINKDMIVVKSGIRNVHYYYIPIDKVEGWDKNIVWLNITETEVKNKYERNEEPDNSKYYLKGHNYSNINAKYTEAYFPVVTIILPKSKKIGSL